MVESAESVPLDRGQWSRFVSLSVQEFAHNIVYVSCGFYLSLSYPV